MSAFPGWPLEIARNALRVSLELFKIMIPVLVVVRVLERLGIIELLAAPLSPFMALAGLPPETRAWLERYPRFELAVDPEEIKWSVGPIRGPRSVPLRILD